MGRLTGLRCGALLLVAAVAAAEDRLAVLEFFGRAHGAYCQEAAPALIALQGEMEGRALLLEDARLGLTDAWVQATVVRPLVAALEPGATATLTVDVEPTSTVDWNRVRSLALVEHRQPGETYDMLQAAVAVPAGLGVDPGSVTPALRAGAVPPGPHTAVVRFDASGDGMSFSGAVRGERGGSGAAPAPLGPGPVRARRGRGAAAVRGVRDEGHHTDREPRSLGAAGAGGRGGLGPGGLLRLLPQRHPHHRPGGRAHLHATEDLGHATLLAGRIIQLGGTPVTDPKRWFELSQCAYDATDAPYVAVLLDENIAGEQCAITTYKKLMDATKDKDMITYNLALQILEQEVEHEEDLQGLKGDLDLMVSRGSR